MFNRDNNRVLFISPHTDDAEFGCGATITRLIEEGHEIYCIAFSAAEESVPDNLPKDINRKDMLRAMRILGVDSDHVFILNYPVRNFPSSRQPILEDLIKFNSEIKPSTDFVPSTFDTHQDHQIVSQEGFRAFKKTSILGYELPWNNLNFTTDCFISLEERNVEKKISSLQCYFSQIGRDYINPDFIRSMLRTRGGQMGKTYAEAFQVIRIDY